MERRGEAKDGKGEKMREKEFRHFSLASLSVLSGQLCNSEEAVWRERTHKVPEKTTPKGTNPWLNKNVLNEEDRKILPLLRG